jgi:hypothetical protein
LPQADWILVEPPRFGGLTPNREGAGGQGVLAPGRKGFLYAPLYLAEATAALRARGREVLALDFLRRPARSAWAVLRREGLARLRRSCEGLLVRSSRATLAEDLAWTRARFAGAEPREGVWLVLPGFEGVPSDVAESGYRVASGASGHDAVRAVLGELASGGGSEDALCADWRPWSLGRKRWVGLVAARGCRLGCGYCPYVLATRGEHRARPVEAVLAEWRVQVERHAPRRMVFRDPVFGLEREPTLALLEGLARREDRVPFEVETRPEVLDGEVLDALLAAGCREIKLGVESVEEAPLVAAGRLRPGEGEAYLAAVEQVLQRAAAASVLVRLFLLTGLPGATPQGEAAARKRFEGRAVVVAKPLQDYPAPSWRRPSAS